MPRAGVSASRIDDGWDWIDPQHDGAAAVDGDAWAGQAYYDWSQTGDFHESFRPRVRPRPRTLRAVPAAESRQRPVPAARAAGAERPIQGPRPDRVERRSPTASPDRLERRSRTARPDRVEPRSVTPRPDRIEPRSRTPRPVAAVPLSAPVPAPEPIVEAPSSTAVAARRTVTITGRGAEGHLPVSPRRPAKRQYERAGFQPDRIAMWAVLLGVLMILAAATSAHAAMLHP